MLEWRNSAIVPCFAILDHGENPFQSQRKMPLDLLLQNNENDKIITKSTVNSNGHAITSIQLTLQYLYSEVWVYSGPSLGVKHMIVTVTQQRLVSIIIVHW